MLGPEAEEELGGSGQGHGVASWGGGTTVKIKAWQQEGPGGDPLPKPQCLEGGGNYEPPKVKTGPGRYLGVCVF